MEKRIGRRMIGTIREIWKEKKKKTKGKNKKRWSKNGMKNWWFENAEKKVDK